MVGVRTEILWTQDLNTVEKHSFYIHWQNVFSNPSSARYAFVGVEKCEIMMLNDLRWTPKMISWSELLNLLEVQTVHLAAPKTHFSQDIELSVDMPVFATSIEMIKFVGKSSHISGENAMMAVKMERDQMFSNTYKWTSNCWRVSKMFRWTGMTKVIHNLQKDAPSQKCNAGLSLISWLWTPFCRLVTVHHKQNATVNTTVNCVITTIT